MKNKRPSLRFVGKAKELLNLNSYINIIGNNAALIDGCKQILECTDVLARVVTSSFEIEIWGSELKLSNFGEGSVEIRGTIAEVKLRRHSRSMLKETKERE